MFRPQPPVDHLLPPFSPIPQSCLPPPPPPKWYERVRDWQWLPLLHVGLTAVCFVVLVLQEWRYQTAISQMRNFGETMQEELREAFDGFGK